MALSTPAKPAAYTAEDLERLSARGYRYELVRGELCLKSLKSGLQGSSASRLSYYAGRVIMDSDLGGTFAAGTRFLSSHAKESRYFVPTCARISVTLRQSVSKFW